MSPLREQSAYPDPLSQPSGRHSAFTVIELLVVLVIIGILAAIAVPNFLRMQSEARLEASAQRLLLDIRRAKSEANRSHVRYFVDFPDTGRSWRIVRGIDNSTAFSPSLVPESRDSLDAGVMFGPQMNGPPNFTDTTLVGGEYSWTTSGFGTSSNATEDCIDGEQFPTAGKPDGWLDVNTNERLIVACGGPTADLNSGILCLTATRTSKAYAIGYNHAGGRSIQVRMFRYTGSVWEEVQ